VAVEQEQQDHSTQQVLEVEVQELTVELAEQVEQERTGQEPEEMFQEEQEVFQAVEVEVEHMGPTQVDQELLE
jgi:hypothetical protein